MMLHNGNALAGHWAGKHVLITGGTGSLGQELLRQLLELPERPSRIVVFSRDEFKQYHLLQRYPVAEYPQLQFMLGDVRDRQRLVEAFENMDVVIHTAAIKQVQIAEMNPGECMKTNLHGSVNVIEAARQAHVKQVIAISTDKAVSPLNVYGTSKLYADLQFLDANRHGSTRFVIVRLGNLLASRGSVVEIFEAQKASGKLTVTHPDMTRFCITIADSATFVLKSGLFGQGGEIFVPKMPSYRISDLAEAICPGCQQLNIGIRKGEKMHEDLITPELTRYSLDFGDYFIVLQDFTDAEREAYRQHHGGQPVEVGSQYGSAVQAPRLDAYALRLLLDGHRLTLMMVGKAGK